jgi:putative colanic acid biosynthesis acetyltransferase WcaF
MSSSKVRLDQFKASKNFDRGAGKFKETCWYLCKWIFFLTAFPFPSSFKCFLLRLFGAVIGIGVVIKPRVNVHLPWKLEIGNHSWIGEEVFILSLDRVSIGNNVCVSQRAFLCAGNHDFKDPSFSYRNGPIKIDDGVWIGASVFVAPNTTIGIDAVVTAGTVVTGNLNANGIYSGNPATYVKPRWGNI